MVARICDGFRLETQPSHSLNNGLFKYFLFLLRICIVKSKVALPTMILCEAEIDSYGLAVADMQEAVRLWRDYVPNNLLDFSDLFL